MNWTTKDGKEILISEMEDGHLERTMALIRRCKFKFTTKWGGGRVPEDIYYDEEETDLCSHYEAMQLEQRLRKIESVLVIRKK